MRGNGFNSAMAESILDRLLTAIAKEPIAEAVWRKLPPSHKREHLAYIEEAKKTETQERRIAKTVQALLRKQ